MYRLTPLILLLLLALPLLQTSFKTRAATPGKIFETFALTRSVKVVSRRVIGRTARRDGDIPNPTIDGTVARNEADTHADTCCAGANWKLMEYTGEMCEVSLFLNEYDLVTEIRWQDAALFGLPI